MQNVTNATAAYYAPAHSGPALVLDLGPVGRWVLQRSSDAFHGAVLRVSVDGLPDDATSDTLRAGVVEIQAERPAGPSDSGTMTTWRQHGVTLLRLTGDRAGYYDRLTPVSLPLPPHDFRRPRVRRS